MAQLTKGMYGGEFCRTSDVFGLRCGQMRSTEKLTHNSGWYNKAGEKIGWGDLSAPDMVRIAAELDADEFFIVLSEGDSYWSHRENGVSESEPGIAYVLEHAMYVIAPKRLIIVNKYDDDKTGTMNVGGHPFEALKPEAVASLLKILGSRL